MKNSLIILLVISLPIFGQKSDTTMVLPPLSAVLAAAVDNSPMIKRERSSEEMSRQDLSLAKKEWLRGLTIEGSSQYGSYGDQTANKLYLGNRIGATIKISLEDIFTWGNKSEKYEAAVAMTEYNRQHLEQELKQIITSHYSRAMTNIALVKIASQGYNNAVIQQQNAEDRFRQGDVSLADFTSIMDMVTNASMKLERARGDMREELMMLEEMIGVPLNSLGGAQ